KKQTMLAVMNNAMALGVMSHLRRVGTAVPDQLSFVSYGDIHNRELLYFQPTVLAQNPRRIGELAAGFLLQRMQNPAMEAQKIMLSGEMIIGNSVTSLL
ncbi:MAG: substrate-binding domain-containing protein, partial [Planctomycetes bacterium]|nr:substrate-binding domain-containing protein [Planctomycetota bacterium]